MSSIFFRTNTSTSLLLKISTIRREDFSDTGDVQITAEIEMNNQSLQVSGVGNGPISAFVDSMYRKGWKDFTLIDYRQHSIGSGSKTKAALTFKSSVVTGSATPGLELMQTLNSQGFAHLLAHIIERRDKITLLRLDNSLSDRPEAILNDLRELTSSLSIGLDTY